jgi:hypothetical protein
MQGGVVDAANTIRDVDFNSPFNNIYDLENPFLVEFNNNTTTPRTLTMILKLFSLDMEYLMAQDTQIVKYPA